MTKQRPRTHVIALACASHTESRALNAIARDRECNVEHLPASLVADVRSELMAGMRPLLELLALLLEPHAFAPEQIAHLVAPGVPETVAERLRQLLMPPIADELEPEPRAESVDLRPAAVPDLGEDHWGEPADVLFEIDDSAIDSGAPFNDPKEVSTPVHPLPRRDQRPTVRVANPRLFDPRPTGRTLSSHPPPPPDAVREALERPTVRVPPPLPPRKLPPLPPARRKPTER